MIQYRHRTNYFRFGGNLVMLDSSEVPQADILSDVIKTISYVQQHRGANFSMIARHIGKGERQGRYYRHAAQLLGFIDNHQNYAWILPDGEYFLSLNSQEQTDYLRQRVRGIRVFELAEQLIRLNPGCSEEHIEQMLIEEGITVSTGDRRTSTIVSWMLDLNIIRITGESLYIR